MPYFSIRCIFLVKEKKRVPSREVSAGDTSMIKTSRRHHGGANFGCYKRGERKIRKLKVCEPVKK